MSLCDSAAQLKLLYLASNKKIKYISKKQKAVARKKVTWKNQSVLSLYCPFSLLLSLFSPSL